MRLINAERIVRDILRLVDAEDQATFVELDRHAPGFHARRKRDGRQPACCEPFDKVILWAGVSASGITAMSYLFESGLILPDFVSHLVYQQCANLPALPRAGTVPLTEEQWGPAILRRGPFPDLTAEEERRSTETLLAARGAARERYAETPTPTHETTINALELAPSSRTVRRRLRARKGRQTAR
jgi:hypothetical protein